MIDSLRAWRSRRTCFVIGCCSRPTGVQTPPPDNEDTDDSETEGVPTPSGAPATGLAIEEVRIVVEGRRQEKPPRVSGMGSVLANSCMGLRTDNELSSPGIRVCCFMGYAEFVSILETVAWYLA